MSVPVVNASINDFVPDLAIVPKLLTKSFFVIPIPVSIICNCLFSLSGINCICNDLSLSNTLESLND